MRIAGKGRPCITEIPLKTAEPRARLRLALLFDGQLICLILGLKALILLFGVQTYLTLRNKPLGSAYDWFSIWNRWDALHYLSIARTGYVLEGAEARNIAFFP